MIWHGNKFKLKKERKKTEIHKYKQIAKKLKKLLARN